MPIQLSHITPFPANATDAVRQLVDSVELDTLVVGLLEEGLLPLLSRDQEAKPSRGDVQAFYPLLKTLCPAIFLQPGLKIVTDAGGARPRVCASYAAQQLCDNGSGDLGIAVISGDNLFDRIEELLAAGCSLANRETGEPLGELRHPLVAAHALLGAQPVASALGESARLVLTGAIDPRSLLVGPMMHAMAGSWNDTGLLAGVTSAAQILLAGARLAMPPWPQWGELGGALPAYPVLELDASRIQISAQPRRLLDGLALGGLDRITKRAAEAQLRSGCRGGTELTTPDLAFDVSGVVWRDVTRSDIDWNDAEGDGVEGAEPKGAGSHGGGIESLFGEAGFAYSVPDHYEVQLFYHRGYAAIVSMRIDGQDAKQKAESAAEWLRQQAGSRERSLHITRVESYENRSGQLLEIEVESLLPESVKHFVREAESFSQAGLLGIRLHQSQPADVFPIFALWPTTVPKSALEPSVEIRPAREWL